MVYAGTFVNPHCDRNAPLSLHACGGGLFVKHFSHGPTVRDEYIIHYIINGQGYLETPEGTFHYTEGDIFCIYPGEVIKYYTNGTRTNMCFINFVGTEAGKIYDTIGITHQVPVIHVNSNSLVNAVYKCLNYGIETENPSEHIAVWFTADDSSEWKQRAAVKGVCGGSGSIIIELLPEGEKTADLKMLLAMGSAEKDGIRIIETDGLELTMDIVE